MSQAFSRPTLVPCKLFWPAGIECEGHEFGDGIPTCGCSPGDQCVEEVSAAGADVCGDHNERQAGR